MIEKIKEIEDTSTTVVLIKACVIAGKEKNEGDKITVTKAQAANMNARGLIK